MANLPSIGRELLDVPMGDMIRDMAFAIAEAQMKLDSNSIEVAEMMGGLKAVTDANGDVTFTDSRVFFGKEKMTLEDAVATLNSTTDQTNIAAIKKADLASDIVPPSGTTGYTIKTGKDKNTVIWVASRLSMLELGFTPTFYQFVDTIIEVKISIKYTLETTKNIETTTKDKDAHTSFKRVGFRRGLTLDRTVSTSQVNASYSQKYSYSAEGSSLLRTKLVPIPPPAILEERIRQQMEIAREKAPAATNIPA